MSAAWITATVAVLVIDYYAKFGIATQWFVALVSLFAVGIAIKEMNGLQGWLFIYLLGSRKGLNFIDRLSKVGRRFWSEMAVWGLVLSLGAISYFVFRRMISKKQYAFGLLSLAVILFLVLPYLSVALPLINIPQLQSAISSSSAQQGINYLGIAFDAITIITGFAGYVFIALIYNAASILYGIASFLVFAANGTIRTSLLTSQVPGVAPIIPGIDIPLFAGIISLATILIVHEFSHGLLAREAKVKLKSLGLLVFGIIPVGAFVEPDEKQISKLNKLKQTKIFSAGISANFVTMLVFFALTLVFMYLFMPGIIKSSGVFIASTTKGLPAYNAIPAGTQLLYWNGYKIQNLGNLSAATINETPNSTVKLVTSNGTYSFVSKAVNYSTKGMIGVNLYQSQTMETGFYPDTVYFLYTLFALAFMLNFLVAVVNLLPLPGFDGWRIYQTNIKSKSILKALMVIIIASLLINVMQWVFFV